MQIYLVQILRVAHVFDQHVVNHGLKDIGGVIRDHIFLALVSDPPLPRECLTKLFICWLVWIDNWSFIRQLGYGGGL